MFSRLWSRFRARLHSHRHAHSGRCYRHAHGAFAPSVRAASPAPFPLAAGFPKQCPLCDKKCVLAEPRCKHGAAFIQFLHASQNGARHV